MTVVIDSLITTRYVFSCQYKLQFISIHLLIWYKLVGFVICMFLFFFLFFFFSFFFGEGKCKKDRGMYYPLCDGAYKTPLLLIRKSST